MNESELLKLATLVLCDTPPLEPELFYVVGETKDNEASVFSVAARQMGTCPITITGGDATAGYPGPADWSYRLVHQYGVADSRLKVIPLQGPPNTFAEALALVQYAVACRLRIITICAAPFHQLRAFLSVLGAMRKLAIDYLRVYNHVGNALPWSEEALHSQGKLRATRVELILEEYQRIVRYTAKGDLVTIGEALAYLRQRGQPM